SGGSVGYDHKAMGITARGAWEAVKRHFRETERDGRPVDIQAMPFTAVGCGDMSGDVFGNGLLLSKETRLLAAFDHRDIFIDPAPDAGASFAERRRLFDMPRSSWADYDKTLISEGGGVFSRREKEIRLSEAAAAAIGWDKRSGPPTEVIAALLKAPVDLLFFGGIGTYIRASGETNADVGDRANDALRVTGRDVRAKVVGEGANLGATQRGRIEFAQHGGRINTDAIDNSAGVNTSDVEVNIKIALKTAMETGRLTREARNTLLASMTDEVADLVLANNYEQTLALSLEQRKSVKALPLQARFMTVLEEGGLLNREVETLPSESAILMFTSTSEV
ncbi:NAD-glutamate dehydrogenase, partial [bacterium]